MSYDIEDLYIIRVREENELMRASRLGELEQILGNDGRAKLEHVIEPIAAAIAFIYDAGLVNDLENNGYELLKQQKVRMIENKEQKE